jgi:hypothetical protein
MRRALHLPALVAPLLIEASRLGQPFDLGSALPNAWRSSGHPNLNSQSLNSSSIGYKQVRIVHPTPTEELRKNEDVDFDCGHRPASRV